MRVSFRLRRAWFTTAVILAFSGCRAPAPLEIDLEFEPPSFGIGALEAVILAFERPSALDVVAIEWPSGRGLEAVPTLAEYDGSYPVVMTAWLYDRPLADLLVHDPGRIARAAVDAPAAAIPSSRDLQQRVIGGENPGRWEPITSSSEALQQFRSASFPDPTSCAKLRGVPLALDTEEPVRVVAPLWGDSAMVVTGRPAERAHVEPSPPPPPRVYRIWGTSPSERVDTAIRDYSTTIGAGRIDAAYQDEIGQLWVVTTTISGGHPILWRGYFPQEFRKISTLTRTNRDEVRWLLTEPEGGPPRSVLAQTKRGAIYRLDLATEMWTEIRAPHRLNYCFTIKEQAIESIRDVFHFCGGLTWTGSGEVLAQDPSGAAFTLIRGTQVLPVTRAHTQALHADVARTELGVLTAFSWGGEANVFRLGDDLGWSPVAENIRTQDVNALARFGGGFVFSGTAGYLIQYNVARPRSPVCPSIDGIAAGMTVLDITPLEAGAFVLSGWTGWSVSSPTFVVRVELEPR